MHGWGPKGFAMLVAKVSLRPRGIFHYGMHETRLDLDAIGSFRGFSRSSFCYPVE